MKKIVIVLLVIIVGVSVWYLMKYNKSVIEPVACTEEAKICPDGFPVGRSGPNCEFDPCPKGEEQKNNGVACTMEAKQCPDGSAVGRSGPNCEFSPCP